jgi:hypothetical protein
MGPTIAPENTTFVPLSFEGPGCYSSDGGLGVRITNLSQALAHQGFATHLFFIGDSVRRGDEAFNGGQLSLHPWCQWISQYYPKGVYEGENQKLTFQARIQGLLKLPENAAASSTGPSEYSDAAPASQAVPVPST